MGDTPIEVLIAQPTYGGEVTMHQMHLTLAGMSDASHKGIMCSMNGAQTSLLARCHNMLLAQAFNRRLRGPKPDYYLNMHSDVAPMRPDWVVAMVEEMRASGAQVLSAVSPIKTPHGHTSTAVGRRSDRWNNRVLTLHEVFKLPETFGVTDVTDDPDAVLLVNTGLMLLDMSWPGWMEPEPLYFTILDRIRRDPGKGGDMVVEVVSEDWHFSYDVAERGGKVLATRKIPVVHRGTADYTSAQPWGEETADKPIVQMLAVGAVKSDAA